LKEFSKYSEFSQYTLLCVFRGNKKYNDTQKCTPYKVNPEEFTAGSKLYSELGSLFSNTLESFCSVPKI
jgi:hypothetical protein